MSIYPSKVLIREEGPREGFQSLPKVVATEYKLKLISALCETGVSSIETTAFVRPDRVPQHADAEQVVEGLPANFPVRFRALYLNRKGFERASSFTQLDLEGAAMVALSESFLLKNNNRTHSQAIEEVVEFAELFKVSGLSFERLMVSTCFGDEDEGRKDEKDVVTLLERVFHRLADAGLSFPEEITYADTTGWGNPRAVEKLIDASRSLFPQQQIGFHFHDTRGLGLANVYAALRLGIDRFDSSVAGLGGCPFISGAAGNIATEDLAFLCHELGVETGLDLERYRDAAELAEKIVGHQLPGKLLRGGLLRTDLAKIRNDSGR